MADNIALLKSDLADIEQRVDNALTQTSKSKVGSAVKDSPYATFELIKQLLNACNDDAVSSTSVDFAHLSVGQLLTQLEDSVSQGQKTTETARKALET